MKRTDLHELRKDPLLGRWIAVLNPPKPPLEYDFEPAAPEGSCFLCGGRERETPPQIMAIADQTDTGKWWTRVIPNVKPLFHIEGELGRSGEGMYDRMNSIGANEIIIESPGHSLMPEDIGTEQMVRVILTYKERMADLERDPRIRYTLIYKNHGRSAGAVYSHPVSHLASTPIIPKRVKEELDGAKQYFEYKERCIFCDIINEERRVGERIVLESEKFLVFCPYASKFPFECWIIPKRHNCAFQDSQAAEFEDLGASLSVMLKKIKKLFGDPPLNYFIHSAPNRIPRKNHWHTLGEDFHWHLEIMPRLLTTSGFEWGSGFYILPTSPESASKYLREA